MSLVPAICVLRRPVRPRDDRSSHAISRSESLLLTLTPFPFLSRVRRAFGSINHIINNAGESCPTFQCTFEY